MPNFEILAEAKIRKDADLVISKKFQDGEEIVVMAQRLNVPQGSYSKGIFLKGAILTNEEGLKSLLAAIKEALAELEN